MNEEALSQELFAAARDGQLVDPVSDSEDFGVEAGYRVQERLLELRLRSGERLVGRKLGFTSLAKQRQMGVHEPITGFLTDAMQLAPGRLALSHLPQPRVEPEIAFRLGEDLGGADVDRGAVIAATAEVLAAVEILDSRYRDFRFSLADVVADDTSAAYFVLAGSGVDPSAVDLPGERVEFTCGEEPPVRASGADVLGDPAAAVAWLARRQPLRAGQVVLSGGMTDATAVARGDNVRASFSTLGELIFEID